MQKTLLLCGVGALFVPATVARAQQVEEIIVTAQKREVNLQNVPVTVLPTSGEQIEARDITNAQEFSASVPVVKTFQSPIGSLISIRGIGTPGINQGMEQSASIFHDGIYMGRPQLSRVPFLDVKRVEVLLGPQTVLFGKNTVAGAIHVINNTPTDTFEGDLTASYGSFNEREFTGVVSGPIGKGIAVRLAARKYDTDGFLNNVMTGKKAGSRDEWTLRGQLQFTPTDKTKINLKWERSRFDQGEQTTQLAIFNPFNPTAQAFSDLNTALVAAGTGGNGAERWDLERAVINDGGVLLGQVFPVFRGLPGFPALKEHSYNWMDVGALTVDHQIGNATLTLQTGFAQYRYAEVCDCDFAAVPLIQVDSHERYKQFSQEIRLASTRGNPIDYMVGGYYQDTHLVFGATDSFGSALAFGALALPTPLLMPNVARTYTFDQKARMWSVFGQGTWNATDNTRLTLGLRWIKEDKKARHDLQNRFAGGWDYSALAGLPAGTIAFGDTPDEYDRFLASPFGTTPLGPGAPSPGFITEAIFTSLLGTQEHDLRGARSESKVNWTGIIEHDFSPSVMAYASVSTATKGGGFDARYLKDSANSAGYFSYEPESATNYEVGIKSLLFNNAVRLNLSAFRIDVKDFQASLFDGATAFVVRNAARARSQGIEFDFSWAASKNLTVRVTGAFLDAKWKSFPNAPCWQTPVSPIRGNCINFGTPDAYRDATGSSMQNAPKFSAVGNIAYSRPISNRLKIGAMLNAFYTDGYFVAATADPIYNVQKRHAKLDARLSLGSVDNRWEIAVLGKNLTNKITSTDTDNQPLVSGNAFGLTVIPRTISVQARLRF